MMLWSDYVLFGILCVIASLITICGFALSGALLAYGNQTDGILVLLSSLYLAVDVSVFSTVVINNYLEEKNESAGI